MGEGSNSSATQPNPRFSDPHVQLSRSSAPAPPLARPTGAQFGRKPASMDQMSLVLKTKMLGALLRGVRKQAGKSLKQTAEIVGISRSTLASYELGKKGISLPELEQLAFHFDVPLGGLLARRPEEAQRKAVFDPKVVVSFRQKMIGALLRQHRT